MTVNLPRDLQVYLEDRVASRASRSTDEAVADALRLLRNKDERRAKLDALREEIMVGIEQCERGEKAPFDPRAILKKVRETRAAARKGA